MNKNLLIIVAVVVVVIGGFFLYTNQAMKGTGESNYTMEPETPTINSQEITVTLSEQNSSKEMGTATLTEMNGKVKVTLSLTGAPTGVSQPAHIHVGTCPPGDVKYQLTSPLDGQSETLLDVTFTQLKAELPLAINVHKSAQEAQVYVACGDILDL